MNARFVRNLQIVSSIHAAVLLVLICLPFANHLLFWKQPMIIHPVDFMVVVPDQSLSSSSGRDINATIVKLKRDVAAIDREEKRKQKKLEEQREKERREREEAEKREQARKLKGPDLGPPSRNPTDKPLSPEKIKEYLNAGAKAGEQNLIPAEEDRCFELIRRAFYDAWAQPSYDEVGTATADVEVRLQKDGSIFGVRMTRKSGNNVLDTTVMQAATTVKRVDGLTPAFLGKFEDVTVTFEVKPE